MLDSHFCIGDIKVNGNVILAPMVGISDMPYRILTRSMGNALSWTAFVNAQEVIYGHPHRLEDRISYKESEHPIVFQLYGSEPNLMLEAAALLLLRKPDILDINLGCSVKAISARGAGAGMLRDMQKVSCLIKNLTENLPLPITTKIRLGWDENTRNHVEIAQMLENAGSKMITVHARTRSQHFGHTADWSAIEEIKRAVKVPVVGNGDVNTSADIDRMLATTGCDAVMIGRAAIGNPWIFSNLDPVHLSAKEKISVINQHLDIMCSFYGESRAIILFRKHASGYLRHFYINRDQRAEILQATSKESFLFLLSKHTLQ